MSFATLKQIEYRVALTQKISINHIIGSLIGVQASILKHTKTGDLYRLPGSMKNEARKIYKTFGLKRAEKAEIYIAQNQFNVVPKNLNPLQTKVLGASFVQKMRN